MSLREKTSFGLATGDAARASCSRLTASRRRCEVASIRFRTRAAALAVRKATAHRLRFFAPASVTVCGTTRPPMHNQVRRLGWPAQCPPQC
eukprot:1193061-Prymnesium_polylepis.2